MLKNNPESVKDKIAKLIQEKAEFLIPDTTEINLLSIPLKKVVPPPKERRSKKRLCKVTGLDISMQKSNSRTLSHTGLYYYYRTHPEIYAEVKRKFLTDVWRDSDHKTQVEIIAHNIRNKRRRQKEKQESLYNHQQPLLFPLPEVIIPEIKTTEINPL